MSMYHRDDVPLEGESEPFETHFTKTSTEIWTPKTLPPTTSTYQPSNLLSKDGIHDQTHQLKIIEGKTKDKSPLPDLDGPYDGIYTALGTAEQPHQLECRYCGLSLSIVKKSVPDGQLDTAYATLTQGTKVYICERDCQGKDCESCVRRNIGESPPIVICPCCDRPGKVNAKSKGHGTKRDTSRACNNGTRKRGGEPGPFQKVRTCSKCGTSFSTQDHLNGHLEICARRG
ncbi:hypothetical protein EDD37DRAFT_140403 [Exophiala viscosa]|uniref:C2H2-type domain-containing protein n=1 Tax=Exophiala viscosa TaxID=2486360 RepID=A0AAN6DN78_9EURO|nr:hypothetical protein EDD36DRAFT_84982 [Exophiala viscosa]KAI1620978.1 hypothetical protein EDD37DRAFT_140403 [Exophiala viscosa]